MIYRTLSEAQHEYSPVSWRSIQTVRVTLANGRTFFRPYTFDATRHACKRCRHAQRRPHHYPFSRVSSDGHICDQCGNPFAGFVRRYRRREYGEYGWQWITTDAWRGLHRLHSTSARPSKTL